MTTTTSKLRDDYDASRLRAMAGDCADPNLRKRLLVVASLYDGVPRHTVLEDNGVGARTLARWLMRFHEQGHEGLANPENGAGTALPATLDLPDTHDAAALRAIAAESDDPDQSRRLLAIAAVYDGATKTAAAKANGTSLSNLVRWIKAFLVSGPDGLRAHARSDVSGPVGLVDLPDVLAVIPDDVTETVDEHSAPIAAAEPDLDTEPGHNDVSAMSVVTGAADTLADTTGPSSEGVVDFRAMAATVSNEKFARRFEALAMLQDGADVSDVADRLGVSQQSVGNWVRLFEFGGAPALLGKVAAKHKEHASADASAAATLREIAQEPSTRSALALRIKVVAAQLDGSDREDAAELGGVTPPLAQAWLRDFREGGIDRLRESAREMESLPYRSDFAPNDIHAAAFKTDSEPHRERLTAVAAVYEGKEPQRVARVFGVRPDILDGWLRAFLDKGPEGLRHAPAKDAAPDPEVANLRLAAIAANGEHRDKIEAVADIMEGVSTSDSANRHGLEEALLRNLVDLYRSVGLVALRSVEDNEAVPSAHDRFDEIRATLSGGPDDETGVYDDVFEIAPLDADEADTEDRQVNGRVRLRKDFTASMLVDLAEGTHDPMRRNRFLALAAIYDGLEPDQVAIEFDFSIHTLYNWIGRFYRLGLEGLPQGGRVLRADYTGPTLRRLAERASDEGFSTRLTALAMVYDGHTRAQIREELGIIPTDVTKLVKRFEEAGPFGLRTITVLPKAVAPDRVDISDVPLSSAIQEIGAQPSDGVDTRALRSDFDATRLRSLAAEAVDFQEKMRYLALAFAYDGQASGDIEKMLGLSTGIVPVWLRMFNLDAAHVPGQTLHGRVTPAAVRPDIRDDYDAAAMRKFAENADKGGDRQRLTAMALIYEGMALDAAADEIGVKPAVAQKWLSNFNTSGLHGLFGTERTSLTSLRRDYDAVKLSKEAEDADDELRSRLLVLADLYSGGHPLEVAVTEGLPVATVKSWVKVFNTSGPSGLSASRRGKTPVVPDVPPLRKDFDAATLKSLAPLSTDWDARRRLFAMASLYAAVPVTKVARMYSVTPDEVVEWVRRFNESNPLEALATPQTQQPSAPTRNGSADALPDHGLGDELRARSEMIDDLATKRRMISVAKLMEGAAFATVQKIFNLRKDVLRQWKQRYDTHGVEGLAVWSDAPS
jgi:transposase